MPIDAANNVTTIRAVTHACILLNNLTNTSGTWGDGDLALGAAPFGLGPANSIVAKRTGVNVAAKILSSTGLEYLTGAGEVLVVAGALEKGFSWVTGQMAKKECSYTPPNP
jgi:hypothetical protein